jgi:hypothetical protein
VGGAPITLAGSLHRGGIAAFIVVARPPNPMGAPAMPLRCRIGERTLRRYRRRSHLRATHTADGSKLGFVTGLAALEVPVSRQAQTNRCAATARA